MVSAEPGQHLAFLCHSSGDKEQVRQLHRRLENDGIRCWFDEEDLVGGQNWELEIKRAIRRCTYVIACLSQGSLTKRGFVQKELKAALDFAEELPDGEIFVIPARLEPCDLPERLSQLHCIDLFAPRGYAHLKRALGLPTPPADIPPILYPIRPSSSSFQRHRRKSIRSAKEFGRKIFILLCYHPSSSPDIRSLVRDFWGAVKASDELQLPELQFRYLPMPDSEAPFNPSSAKRESAGCDAALLFIDDNWFRFSPESHEIEFGAPAQWIKEVIDAAGVYDVVLVPVLVEHPQCLTSQMRLEAMYRAGLNFFAPVHVSANPQERDLALLHCKIVRRIIESINWSTLE